MAEEKFVRREVPVLRIEGRKLVNDYRIVIGIQKTNSNIIYPHPITAFIDREYYSQSKSIHNELGPADVVVSFLNYSLTQVKNKNVDFVGLNGICDFINIHAESFLDNCREIGNSLSTVERKERYLTHFYDYLWENKIIKQDPKIQRIYATDSIDKTKKRKSTVLMSPFKYNKPKQKYDDKVIKKKDMLTQGYSDPRQKQIIRLNYIREFLLIASNMFSDIALAVAFQFYGGLRAGECMNLTVTSIKPQNGCENGEKGMVLYVRDRQQLLFNKSNSKHSNEVKKERDQSLLIDPLIPYLFAKHKVWLKKKKTNETDALFINNRGEPLSVPRYRERFNLLKEFYLGILFDTPGRYQDFREFRETKWSTHIGRGAFTNLCLDGGFNPIQTAILRGDSSPQSMFDYTDILTATWNISRAIGLLSPDSVQNVPLFQMPEINKYWKDVIHFGKS